MKNEKITPNSSRIKIESDRYCNYNKLINNINKSDLKIISHVDNKVDQVLNKSEINIETEKKNISIQNHQNQHQFTFMPSSVNKENKIDKTENILDTDHIIENNSTKNESKEKNNTKIFDSEVGLKNNPKKNNLIFQKLEEQLSYVCQNNIKAKFQVNLNNIKKNDKKLILNPNRIINKSNENLNVVENTTQFLNSKNDSYKDINMNISNVKNEYSSKGAFTIFQETNIKKYEIDEKPLIDKNIFSLSQNLNKKPISFDYDNTNLNSLNILKNLKNNKINLFDQKLPNNLDNLKNSNNCLNSFINEKKIDEIEYLSIRDEEIDEFCNKDSGNIEKFNISHIDDHGKISFDKNSPLKICNLDTDKDLNISNEINKTIESSKNISFKEKFKKIFFKVSKFLGKSHPYNNEQINITNLKNIECNKINLEILEKPLQNENSLLNKEIFDDKYINNYKNSKIRENRDNSQIDSKLESVNVFNNIIHKKNVSFIENSTKDEKVNIVDQDFNRLVYSYLIENSFIKTQSYTSDKIICLIYINTNRGFLEKKETNTIGDYWNKFFSQEKFKSIFKRYAEGTVKKYSTTLLRNISDYKLIYELIILNKDLINKKELR